MWTTYAARRGGYCLEFSGALLSCSLSNFPSKIPLRINYGPEMPPHVGSILLCAASFARLGHIEAAVAGSWLGLMALRFKHPAFRHEDEWRIVIQDPPIAEMKFRAGQFNIKPFIEMCPITEDGVPYLPLKRIVIGPTLREDAVLEEVIGLMLEKYGYEGVTVERCGIPYQD
jgi:hypothetical protein